MKTQEKVKLVAALNNLLANYQIHYQNLRGLHWNIKGPMFFALHGKFEEYYNEVSEVVDELAERVLTIGGQPMQTMKEYLQEADLKELDNISEGNKAVKEVVNDNELLIKKVKEVFVLASESDDEGTVAMLSELIASTEKKLWMLKSFLS